MACESHELFAEEPFILVLVTIQQDVQVVVAEHTLCSPQLDKILDQIDDAGAVRTAIGQVANKHQSTSVGVLPGEVVAQVSDQMTQRVAVAVNVAHDIQGSIEKWLDQCVLGRRLT